MEDIHEESREFSRYVELLYQSLSEEEKNDLIYSMGDEVRMSNVYAALEYGLQDYKYLEARSKYELSLYKYSYGDITFEELETARSKYEQVKEEVTEEIKSISFAD